MISENSDPQLVNVLLWALGITVSALGFFLVSYFVSQKNSRKRMWDEIEELKKNQQVNNENFIANKFEHKAFSNSFTEIDKNKEEIREKMYNHGTQITKLKSRTEKIMIKLKLPLPEDNE